jgi:hypothetical protein
MSEISEPIKKKQTNKQGVRAVGIVVLVFVLIVMLIVGGTKGCSSTSSNQGQTENTEVVCDVSKFANITSTELVELLGKPNNVEKTTTNGFAKFPCVYYDYNNASELGEVSFILINDTVVKLVSYNSYPYNDGKNLLESFNLTMGENGAKNTTDTYARFRCPTDKVDDLWITNIDKSANTFDTLQVTYDMFYFEEWYIPLTDIAEETNYQVWTQNSVKSLLKAPKTAEFPGILDWSIFKNKFYVIAQSYVDAQNSFGATVRSEFTFVYTVDTSSIVYAVFDGEVIANNGYVKTEELVSKLIDKTKTDSALTVKTPEKVDNTEQKTSQEDEKETISSSANTNNNNNNTDKTEKYIPSEDMNEFLVRFILPQYVSVNGKLTNPIEHDSNENTDWCYKLEGKVGTDSYEAMVYPFCDINNNVEDLWIRYLYWNGNLIVENDPSQQIEYSPKKYW